MISNPLCPFAGLSLSRQWLGEGLRSQDHRPLTKHAHVWSGCDSVPRRENKHCTKDNGRVEGNCWCGMAPGWSMVTSCRRRIFYWPIRCGGTSQWETPWCFDNLSWLGDYGWGYFNMPPFDCHVQGHWSRCMTIHNVIQNRTRVFLAFKRSKIWIKEKLKILSW